MSLYDEKVWLSQYTPAQSEPRTIEFDNALEMFAATVKRNPDGDIIRYFDGRITAQELDALSDAFAAGIIDAGFRPGERVVIYAQNIPQFVIAQLGAWKAGGITVSANPMYRERELEEILRDSGATVLVTLQSLYKDVAAHVVGSTDVRTVITTSELEFQSANSGTLTAVERIECPGTTDMTELLAAFRGRTVPPVEISPDTVAFLTYTSGTTGPPKGAMTTHRNVTFNAQTYRDWIGIGADDVILGVAPLFHVTGLVGHIALSLLTGAPLVLMCRMDPVDTVDTIERQRATFTVGSITVFTALMNAQNACKEALASLTKICSGGAPIPPSILADFEEKFGHYIHNIYGLTETTSPSHCVPFGKRAPVDELTGATAVGVPVYDTVARIVDDNGDDLPPGEVGELVTAGPQVMAGYWNKPEATANAISAGVLHTGDVGYMDSAGWFYIIDRKKDQINASGFKVWPREVEDVLYEHEAVREAAVVGVSDSYRGETVKAFVSLQPGSTVTPEELIAFTKKRLATYKCPRIIEIMSDLPKTATGKLLRRELRTVPQS
ncbi:long-chain fatty acid--CoA ligase [Rhodococcus sp. HM1]|uniref:long-chain-fatty-acid--CoA ligase n=1 Tax=Rhodococcus sp. HM1 TaxID=2937759 RepID=UPI00200A90B1|nr:long-chain fatty acid--CoA ligase [Rhodococcus sp. HM1]MCK8675425.1 long-chain fatty acid--CoA ligase [Rhodococcus sp. HM1]